MSAPLESNTAQVADQLHQLAAQLAGDGLEQADRDAAQLVLHAARPPHGATGALAAGLSADVTRQGIAFASSARYWTFVHFGAPRANVRAHPFYTQALEANTSQLVDIYARHLTDTITDTIRG